MKRQIIVFISVIILFALSGFEYEKVKDVKVTSFQKYETSAVNYKMIFLLEFVFDENISLDRKASFIKGLQEFFEKV